jgi:hypothetical protein
LIGIAAFHVLMLLLGSAVLTRVVPERRVANLLGYFHKSVGITTPSPQQVRMVALIWIGLTIVMVDGCIFLLVFIASASNSTR